MVAVTYGGMPSENCSLHKHFPIFLQANCPDFEQMAWFGDMVEFGDTCVEENDEDVNLVPELISRVVMPKLLGVCLRARACVLLLARVHGDDL